MAFEVLPGTGLALPRGAGVLRFGGSEREARWAVATVADVRGTWVCGTGWAFTARYEGLDLLAYGDCPDRLGRAGHDRHGLAAVHLRRYGSEPTGPAAVPVVLRDVDLFGYPAAEVLEALGPGPYPGVTLPRAASPTGHYLPEVRLAAP
ncbi:hypothetical protein BCL76_10558 [Streptomyces sp. CG 926]|uniref:hypothetical protein n=1 Tax=Streptomyces sp. CG 926 TaxID=1882405 RepID=UPI000D6CEC3A|nr:hypothetical protein [Streptomyces sp. CG 926]PWK70108.1 hypothetical protein BCL76_10558 [Streptomyces sp. CG 926]